jgi:hypothetical protein
MPIEQYAYLSVLGSETGQDWEHPEELDALLGVEPTEVQRRSLSPEEPGPRRLRSTWWRLGDREPKDEIDTDVLVRAVLALVQERADGFREYVARHDLTASVNVVITMKAEKTFYGEDGEDTWGVPTPATYLAPETVQTLAALGIGIDFDMYVWTPEDMMEEESESKA